MDDSTLQAQLADIIPTWVMMILWGRRGSISDFQT